MLVLVEWDVEFLADHLVQLSVVHLSLVYVHVRVEDHHFRQVVDSQLDEGLLLLGDCENGGRIRQGGPEDKYRESRAQVSPHLRQVTLELVVRQMLGNQQGQRRVVVVLLPFHDVGPHPDRMEVVLRLLFG